MKLIKLTFGVTVLAFGVASAASSHHVNLRQTVTIGTTQLKAGEYSVEMQGSKAVFKSGKNVVEVPATLSQNDHKYGANGVVTTGSKLIEIDLGGTTEKIVFSSEAGQSAGGAK